MIKKILFKLSVKQKEIYDSGSHYNLIGRFYELYNALPSIKAVSGREFVDMELRKYELCYEKVMNE